MHFSSKLWPSLATASLAFFVAGCGADASKKAAFEKNQGELAALRKTNEEVQRLRTQNRELARLREDFDEVQQLRGEAEEIARLEKENQDLRGEIAETQQAIAQARAVQRAGAEQAGRPAAAQEGAIPLPGQETGDEGVPQEGDQILIHPRDLASLVPGLDTSTIERQEPIAINALLEQQGIVITNYQQLEEMGITNYYIRRTEPSR